MGTRTYTDTDLRRDITGELGVDQDMDRAPEGPKNSQNDDPEWTQQGIGGSTMPDSDTKLQREHKENLKIGTQKYKRVQSK